MLVCSDDGLRKDAHGVSKSNGEGVPVLARMSASAVLGVDDGAATLHGRVLVERQLQLALAVGVMVELILECLPHVLVDIIHDVIGILPVVILDLQKVSRRVSIAKDLRL